MTIAETAEAFRRLHEGPGAFVMPNPWDIGTTRILAGLGYEALATTSAGLAYSLGPPDGEAAVTREEALEHAAVIAGATDLPVNGDLENGFGHDPESVAETIRGAAAAGLVGCSIEDSTSAPGDPIYPLSPGRRAHRAGGGGRCRPALLVHADGARRELPARPQRPRRHDRAAAGLREGRCRRALRARPARHRGHPHASARRSRSPSTYSRSRAARASSYCRRPAFGGSASARASATPRSGPSCVRPGTCASTGRSAASTALPRRRTSSRSWKAREDQAGMPGGPRISIPYSAAAAIIA